MRGIQAHAPLKGGTTYASGNSPVAKKRVASFARGRPVFIKQVYAGTPAAEAGLKPADRIVAIDGYPTRNLRALQDRIGASAPSNRMTVKIWREGETLEIPVAVGKERYQNWHSISFGFRLSSRLDVMPNPGFSILPVAEFQPRIERAELRAPEQKLARQLGEPENAGESGLRSNEGWDGWFVIFGLSSYKRILSQEGQ